MTTLQSDDAAKGAWISISDLAKRKNISRQSAKERVDRLVAKGMIQTRSEGRSRMVDLAAYDRAVGEVGDAIKEAAAETKRETANASKPLRDAQTDRAIYEARLKALDLAERQGNILPIKGEHGIENAAVKAGIVTARELERIVACADDIAVAVSKDGVAGAKRVLKEAARAARERIAAAMTAIADAGAEAERNGPIRSDIGLTGNE